ncbi:MAG: hypothetical protein M3429_10450 [Verrucomicrobiota bacterium]|nr:hypothetical protein [Verrucomicrobiota bacterium]
MSRKYLAHLRELETQAKAEGLGGWKGDAAKRTSARSDPDYLAALAALKLDDGKKQRDF